MRISRKVMVGQPRDRVTLVTHDKISLQYEELSYCSPGVTFGGESIVHKFDDFVNAVEACVKDHLFSIGLWGEEASVIWVERAPFSAVKKDDLGLIYYRWRGIVLVTILNEGVWRTDRIHMKSIIHTPGTRYKFFSSEEERNYNILPLTFYGDSFISKEMPVLEGEMLDD